MTVCQDKISTFFFFTWISFHHLVVECVHKCVCLPALRAATVSPCSLLSTFLFKTHTHTYTRIRTPWTDCLYSSVFHLLLHSASKKHQQSQCEYFRCELSLLPYKARSPLHLRLNLVQTISLCEFNLFAAHSETSPMFMLPQSDTYCKQPGSAAGQSN